METPQKQFYRDQLRSARAVALADAEGFHAVLHSLELIGQELAGMVLNLNEYKAKLSDLADDSTLSAEIPSKWPKIHTPFRALYEELRQARNDAVHQGAHARILTGHAVELTIILEDALMVDATKVSQFMVRDVIEAEHWHPVSYVRQQMLKHAFSYIPVFMNMKWRLISDSSVVQYLRSAPSKNGRLKRLATSVFDACESSELVLMEAEVAAPDDDIEETLQRMGEAPILIIDPVHEESLAGLLTASDVL